MCTQAAFRALKGIVNERVKKGLGKTLPSLEPNLKIRPTDPMPIVRLDAGEWLLETRSWKLLPSWVRVEDLPKWKSYSTWNARSEEVATKPSWTGAFKSKRCLLVLEGFYEKGSFFRNADPEEMTVIAGLYDDWDHDGEEIRSCTMVTTEPNELVAPLHHRMPAILGPESWDEWLSLDTRRERLLCLLRPCPSNWLNLV
jgi:putative SOS response-associated peptidase YedK